MPADWVISMFLCVHVVLIPSAIHQTWPGAVSTLSVTWAALLAKPCQVRGQIRWLRPFTQVEEICKACPILMCNYLFHAWWHHDIEMLSIVRAIHRWPTQIPTQITRFTWPTWGPPGSCRPQLGPMVAPWTLLSGQCHSNFLSVCLMAHHHCCVWQLKRKHYILFCEPVRRARYEVFLAISNSDLCSVFFIAVKWRILLLSWTIIL